MTIAYLDNNTRRYPRTLQEAFGPHTSSELQEENGQQQQHPAGHITWAQTIVALALIAAWFLAALASSNAQAALVCTEVTRPDGTTGQACKNVPDQPARPPGQGKPKPTPPKPTPPQPEPPTVEAPTPDPSVEAAPPPVAAPGPAVMQPEFNQAIAQAAALVLLTPTASGSTTLNLSAAHYRGQSALGLTLAHRPSRQTVISLGASAGTQKPTNALLRISAGLQF